MYKLTKDEIKQRGVAIKILQSYIDKLIEYNNRYKVTPTARQCYLASVYYMIIIRSVEYEIKYYNEIKKANKEIFKYLDPLPENDCASDIIELFKMYYNVWHRVRSNTETLSSVEVIRLSLKKIDTKDEEFPLYRRGEF